MLQGIHRFLRSQWNAMKHFDYAFTFHIRVMLIIACGKIRAGDFRLTLIWLHGRTRDAQRSLREERSAYGWCWYKCMYKCQYIQQASGREQRGLVKSRKSFRLSKAHVNIHVKYWALENMEAIVRLTSAHKQVWLTHLLYLLSMLSSTGHVTFSNWHILKGLGGVKVVWLYHTSPASQMRTH